MVPETHKQFTETATARLQYDNRILGLAAAGSWVQNQLDKFSELDLTIVLDPGRAESVLDNKEAVAQSLGNCLACFPAEQAEAENRLTCLYDEPLVHVRLKFVSLEQFSRRSENPEVLWERDGALTRVIEEKKPESESHNLQWMEDRFWVWLHYGASRLGRGEIFAALETLSLLRAQVLAPLACTKAGRTGQRTALIEKNCSPEDLESLKATISPYEARACERALKASAKMYVGLREALDPGTLQRNRRAEMASLRYLHEVSEKLR